MKILRILLLLCCFTITSSKLFCEDLPAQNCFIGNTGQWANKVKWFTSTGGMNCWVTDSGLVFDYYKYNHINLNSEILKEPSRINIDTNYVKTGHIIKTYYQNARNPVTIGGLSKQPWKYNFYIGNNASNWDSSVWSAPILIGANLWDSVDVKYYYENNNLRYDYIVHPNGNPNSIKIKYDCGNNSDSVLFLNSDGTQLGIRTSVGQVLHSGLYAYQIINGVKRQVPCKFVLTNNIQSFQVGEYDTSQDLIIDPLVWAGFLSNGSSLNDLSIGTSIDVYKANAFLSAPTINFMPEGEGIDKMRDIVVSGYTNSYSEINKIDGLCSGPYSYRITKDKFVIYVAEMKRNGSQLKYLTLIGSPTHSSIACEVNCFYTDTSRNTSSVAFTGYTDATDYPVKATNADTSFFHQGATDVIITKLKNGVLDKSRYLGSTEDDKGYGISFKDSTKLSITGYTTNTGTGFPITGNFLNNASGKDIFISSLDSNLNLTNSDIFGGDGDDIAYDIDGEYIAGSSNSNSLNGGLGTRYYGNIPNFDSSKSSAFVAKWYLSTLQEYFVNGAGNESAFSVIANDNNVSIAGVTESIDLDTANLPHYSIIGNKLSTPSAFYFSYAPSQTTTNVFDTQYTRIAMFDSSAATCIKEVYFQDTLGVIRKLVISGNFKNQENINTVLEIDKNFSSTNDTQNGFIFISTPNYLIDSNKISYSHYINGNSKDDICSFATCAKDEIHTLTNSNSSDLQVTSNTFQPNNSLSTSTIVSKYEGLYTPAMDSPRLVFPLNSTQTITKLDSFKLGFLASSISNYVIDFGFGLEYPLHFELQVADNISFSNPIRYKSDVILQDTMWVHFNKISFIQSKISKGKKYYCRVALFDPYVTTQFSTAEVSFILVDTLAINLTTGDNWISSNIKPLSTNWKDIIGTTNINKVNNISIDGKIFTRNDINLGKAIFDSSKVYKINTTSPFKLVFKGYLIDSNTTLVNTRNYVESQPYYSKDIPYLGSIERNVEDIWALNKNGLIFKDFKGHYYIPSLGINTFTSKIAPGNAYRIISSDPSFAWQEAKYTSPTDPIISYNNKRESWSDSVYASRYDFYTPTIPNNSNIFKLIFANNNIPDSTLVLAINNNSRNVIGFGFAFNNTAILKLQYTNEEFQFYAYDSFGSPKEIQRRNITNDTLNEIFTMGGCMSCSNIFHYKNNSLFSTTGSEITIYTEFASQNSSSANTLNLLAYPNPANVGVEGKIRPVFLETSVYLKDTVLSNGSIVKILDYNTASASEPYLLSFSAYDINNPNQPMPNFFINRVDYNGVSQINDLLRTETVRFVPPYPSTYIIVCTFSRGNTVLSTSIQKILVTR